MECWKKVCHLGHLDCQYEFFDCKAVGNPNRAAWFEASNISNLCHPTATTFFHFGIFSDSFASTSSTFFSRYFYCFWWGLRNLRYFNLFIYPRLINEGKFEGQDVIIISLMFNLLQLFGTKFADE